MKPKSHKTYSVGSTLHVSAKRLSDYKRRLKKLVKIMRENTEKNILKIFRGEAYKTFKEESKKLLTQDKSITSETRIMLNKLLKKYTKIFGDKAKNLAESMLSGVLRDNKVALNNSVKKAVNEVDTRLEIKSNFVPNYLKKSSKEKIKALLNENLKLIKSIPETYYNQLTGDIYRSLTSKLDLEEIKNHLVKRGGMAENRAANIAEDQTRKASNVINAERMQSIGVKKFEWIHSGGGQKPRKLHMEMDGKIYSFDDLPVIDENTGERGLPGQLPYCRCTMRPVWDFELEEK